jgi:predicted transcriptional regulator YdeE
MTKGFKIIGISTITTTKDFQSHQDMTNLWGQFYDQNIFDEIPNKVSYDFTDEYITIIGVPVSPLVEILFSRFLSSLG